MFSVFWRGVYEYDMDGVMVIPSLPTLLECKNGCEEYCFEKVGTVVITTPTTL